MPQLLVFDFDGTLTDAEEEGAPFRGGYLADVAVLCDRPVEEVDALARRFEAEVAADPQAYGWVFGGQIVAPAVVDPYLRMMPVARKVFDHYGRFLDSSDRDRLLDGILYKYNYPKTKTAFRAGARELLVAVDGPGTFVVTNSHTEPVQDKIRALSALGSPADALFGLAGKVSGRARKYVLDAAWDAVPESLSLPGLQRPILLRRRLYGEVLDALRQSVGASWDEVVVVGDIFELDLALPLALGARVGLVTNAHTPQYERDHLAGHSRGAVLPDLSSVHAWLRA